MLPARASMGAGVEVASGTSYDWGCYIVLASALSIVSGNWKNFQTTIKEYSELVDDTVRKSH